MRPQSSIAYASRFGFRPDFCRNLTFFRPDSGFTVIGGKVLKLRSRRRCSTVGLRVRCRKPQEGENESNGEEPPESLFVKELRRRGMTPTSSLLEDSNRSMYGLDGDIKLKEDDSGSSNINLISTDIEKSLSNQRERSMALNSEGLEGLIPRAKLLLTTGGTFFIGFWPLILITLAFFSALYLYFGPSFIHDASKTPIGPPPYIDPYALLEEERISQTVRHVN